MMMRARVVAATAVILLLLHAAAGSVPSKSRLRVAEIREDDIAANSVSNAKLQPDSVSGINIQAGAINGDKIARNAVDERHFAPGSVTTKGAAIETVTIILRAQTTVSDPGGATPNPRNRVLLKPRITDAVSSSTVQHHHVPPGGFYKAFGRATGPGTILGWYPSLNGHLLRYQADRALRTLSCSNVYTEEHFIRKYDVNIADYAWTPDVYTLSGTNTVTETNFVPRFMMNGARNGAPIQVFTTGATAGVFAVDASPGGDVNAGFEEFTYDDIDNDSRLSSNVDFGVFSTILSATQVLRQAGDRFQTSFINGVPGTTGEKDNDLRGTRDAHFLMHRYVDLEFESLCGRLGDNTYGPDNVKCIRAQPWHDRIYYSNDVRSESSYTADLVSPGALTNNNLGDTEDNFRADLPPAGTAAGDTLSIPRGFPFQRDYGFAAASDFVLDTAFMDSPWSRGASANTPPERCSIYTNIGDLRSETYDPAFRDVPGPAEGTPVYSPSLERVSIDDKGLIEVRYAGRGLPGASQPDIAITVVVMLNDRVQYEVTGADVEPLVEDFP